MTQSKKLNKLEAGAIFTLMLVGLGGIIMLVHREITRPSTQTIAEQVIEHTPIESANALFFIQSTANQDGENQLLFIHDDDLHIVTYTVDSHLLQKDTVNLLRVAKLNSNLIYESEAD